MERIITRFLGILALKQFSNYLQKPSEILWVSQSFIFHDLQQFDYILRDKWMNRDSWMMACNLKIRLKCKNLYFFWINNINIKIIEFKSIFIMKLNIFAWFKC